MASGLVQVTHCPLPLQCRVLLKVALFMLTDSSASPLAWEELLPQNCPSCVCLGHVMP